jgi:hypothetical protein
MQLQIVETGTYLLVKEEEGVAKYSMVVIGVHDNTMYMFIPTEEGSRKGNMYKLSKEQFLNFCETQNIVGVQGPLQDEKEE